MAFRRTDGHKYSKLGVRRKNKQVYRKAKGIDNKIRLGKRHRPVRVKIGFKNEKTTRGLINGMEAVMIHNVKDLEKVKENMIGIIGKIGNKKRKEVAEIALEKKIKLLNLDAEKFLKKIENKMKLAEIEKTKRSTKKKVKDKKAKEKEDKEKKEAEKKEEKKEEKKSEEKLEEKVGDKTDISEKDKKEKTEVEGEKSISKPAELVKDTKTETKQETKEIKKDESS